ncbi:hypothetical protein HNQ99_000807 [Rhizorhapis suberifaciens]|uniref:Uncharacterized protein n=1 Tax=Rhizorhapis suberifaciens TaxID=13656 RepID=A0A840HSD4_9SPHN|nr:hypothetical protein [Rhizorhapis suberifaciens]
MFSLMASLLFAISFAAAITVMAVTFADYRDKMFAALKMQPLHRQPALWRMPPRRPGRTGSPRVIRQPRLSRAAA